MKKAMLVFLLCFSMQLNLQAEQYQSSRTLALENDMRGSSAFKEASKLKDAIRAGKLAERTDKALDNLVKTTVGELKRMKQPGLAGELENGWRIHSGFLVRSQLEGYRDLGDHEAVVFLAEIHEKIHFFLGDDICRALRTHDLFVLAYAIPVVFRCVDKVGVYEYERHWVPLLKVVSYWLSYGVCVGATIGGGVVWFCGLVGMVGEQLVGTFIAPSLTDWAYGIFCKDAIAELPGHT